MIVNSSPGHARSKNVVSKLVPFRENSDKDLKALFIIHSASCIFTSEGQTLSFNTYDLLDYYYTRLVNPLTSEVIDDFNVSGPLYCVIFFLVLLRIIMILRFW